ncbi:probable thiopurine S-methyltransferase [Dermacentor silvarum]|uniref:probable thiopurine S-methyltransferase n=1 Tax=Dermacentor silvarum TaxID=543639 RepID=UPI00189BC33B|nr:probable thiopurine S-methyltransferase [Dermacentor silvarum]
MPDTGHAEASLRDYWSQRWSTQDSPWTRHGIHALLRDNADAVLAGKREGTVFLPMCGDATELKWFYDQGFRVVGVEFLETVARSFFAANDLTPLEGHSNVNGCKILQTPDLMLSIYICDLYTFSKDCEGTMDIVWDRGGLVSVREEDRGRYVALLKSLLARNFSYALYTTEYDDTGFQGFPRNVSLPLIRELYGEDYEITQLGVTFIERSYVKTKVIKETLWHLKKPSSRS